MFSVKINNFLKQIFSRKFAFNQKFISLILFFLTLSAIYFYFAKFRLSEAAIEANFWYDNSYPYRVKVTFSSLPILTIPDLQVRFEADTLTPISQKKIKSDCSGINLVDDFGREIPFWIENCNKTNSVFYAKLNPTGVNNAYDIKGGNTQNIYIYYGNTLSNKKTFPPSSVFDTVISGLDIAYSYENDTETLSYDLSGNSKNLSKVDSPTTQPGAFGNAIVYKGDNYSSLPFNSYEKIESGFTLLTWAKMDYTAPGTYDVFGTDYSVEPFELQFSVASPTTSIFQRYLEAGTTKAIVTAPVSSDYFFTGIALENNSGKHFFNRFIGDTTSPAGDYWIYGGDSPLFSYLKMGTGYFNSSITDYFSGPMDEFRLFNRVLTNSEILSYTTNTTIATGYLSPENTCNQLNNFCMKSFVTPSYPGYDLLGKYNSLVTYTVSGEESTEVPLLYFKFNEASGRSLASSNLTGAQAFLGTTISNFIQDEYEPIFYEEVKCIQGSCLYFDGFNDFVEIKTQPGTGGFDNRLTQKDISYSFWIKPFSSPNPNRRYIISSNTEPGSFLNSVYLDASNKIVKFSSNATSSYSVASSSIIPYYKWSHVSITYDYATFNTKIYINGVLDRSFTDSGDININVAKIGLGTSFENNLPSSNNYYKGLVDDFKIYDVEISSDKVLEDYRYGKYLLTLDPDNVARSNLMAYYPLDEADRGTVFDYSDVEAINLYSNTTLNNAPGLFNNAYSPPANNAFFSVPSTKFNNLISTAAYSMWVYTGTYSSNAVLLKKDSGIEGGGFDLQYLISNSKFQGEICGTTLTSTSTSPAQMWSHVLIQSNSRTAQLYVNSKLEASSNCTNNYVGKTNNNNPILVGGTGTSNQTLLGMIDEFKIMENYFGPKQIEIQFNYYPTYSSYGIAPAAFYKLDESDGTSSAVDARGLSTNLEINSSSNYNSWTDGIIGGSYDFSTQAPGVVNFMTGATATPLIEFNDSSIMFSTWIQFPSPHFGNAGTSNNLIFQYGQNLGGTSSDWIVGDSNTFNNTNLLFRPSFWNNSGSGESSGMSFSSSFINTTNASGNPKWYYLTFKGNSNFETYINGDMVSYENDLGIGTSEKNLVLGNDFNNGALALQLFAKLDEVKIHSYERTRDQIIRDMRNASTAPAFNSDAFAQIPTNLRSPIGIATYGTLPIPIVDLNFDDPYGYTDLVHYSYFRTSAGTINFQKSNRTLDGFKNAAGTITPNLSELTFTTFSDFNFQNKDFAISFFVKFPPNQDNTTLAYSSTNFLLERLNDKLNLISTNYNLTSTDSMTTNAWNHIYIQRNKETKVLEMYLNGVFQGSDYSATRTIDLQDLSFISKNTTYYLDEIKVFQNVLDRGLIQNLKNGGFVMNLGSNYFSPESSLGSKSLKFSFCVLGEASNCSPPEAFLRFDEQSDDLDTYLDFIDGGTLVAAANGATSARVAGYSGTGLSGTTNPQFTLNKSYINPTGVRSINFWFEIDPADLTDKPTYFSEANFEIAYSRYTDILSVNNPAVGSEAIWYKSPLDDNKWKNLHMNINEGVIDFYLDGSYVSSYSGTLSTGSEIFSLASSNIDEIKFFEYIRTPNQIAFDYSKNKPYVHLKFDECSGNKLFNSNLNLYFPTLYDVSGNPRNDTGGYHNTGFNFTNPSGGLLLGNCQDSGSTNWYLGRIGKQNNSFFFDGTIFAKGNDYHMNQMNNKGEASISFWINPTNASHTATIIGPEEDSYKGYKVKYNNGRIDFERNTTGISGTLLLTSPSISINSWSHVAVTSEIVSTNQVIKMYINGILVSQDTVTYSNVQNDCSRSNFDGPVTCTTNPAVIGKSFNGYIDELKIYNFSLTNEQVKSDKNNGAAVIFK